MFSWTIVPPDGETHRLGALGVTDDRARALVRAGEALRTATSGARALVHEVTLSFARVAYLYDALVARGRFDPLSGTVMWEEFPGQASRSRLRPLLCQAGDAIPPEAVAAGIADLDTERKRRRMLGLSDDIRDIGAQ
jgi:hypothetical protein